MAKKAIKPAAKAKAPTKKQPVKPAAKRGPGRPKKAETAKPVKRGRPAKAGVVKNATYNDVKASTDKDVKSVIAQVIGLLQGVL